MSPYYERDGIQLYHADCRHMLMLLSFAPPHHVITDPPYGISLKEHGRNGYDWQIANDESQDAGMAVIEWADELEIPLCVFASPDKPWPGKWRNMLVWDKGGAVGGGGDIATCWKRTWELIQINGNQPLNGSRDEAVLRFYIGPNRLHLHPTEKPIELMRYLIEKLTDQGDRILDTFAGSCTTLAAAWELGREAIGCEISEEYCELGAKRLDRIISQGRLFRPEPIKETQRSMFDDSEPSHV